MQEPSSENKDLQVRDDALEGKNKRHCEKNPSMAEHNKQIDLVDATKACMPNA